MDIVIAGGGIAGAYISKKIKEFFPKTNITLLCKESLPPYDRIHLCELLKEGKKAQDYALDYGECENGVELKLNSPLTFVDSKNKTAYSDKTPYKYDFLIITTGSKPRDPQNLNSLSNASVLRSAEEAFKIKEGIKNKDVVILGTGAIALESLDSIYRLSSAKSISILGRGEYVYSNELDKNTLFFIKSVYKGVNFLFNDEIVDLKIENSAIKSLQTKTAQFLDPFLISAIGIEPNIEFEIPNLELDGGILVDARMRTSDPHIYAVGECARMEDGFIAGHVKDCIMQADTAINNIFSSDAQFKREISIDYLKTKNFYLIDIRSPLYKSKISHESLVISGDDHQKFDQYLIKENKLLRYIGINSDTDVTYVKSLIENGDLIDPSKLYEMRVPSPRGKIVCSCVDVREQDLIELVQNNGIEDFEGLREFSQAGRVCGRCKQSVIEIIEKTPKDPLLLAQIKKDKEEKAAKERLEGAKKRLDKYRKLHPKNNFTDEELIAALDSYEISTSEFNRWISMITATMKLHPVFEPLVSNAVQNLNKIPIIWLELADCSGNSEGFIKTARPKIEELIFDFISLDYHDLLMAASGDNAHNLLENLTVQEAGKYVLIVEGAVPLGMDGKFLRLGSRGETGFELLKKCAANAALILGVGSCAFDGGVVAANPNPTGAVGVAQALGRDDIINLPGCPVNPINIVGTLLHYIMFEELPKLDQKNRPIWAYSERIHDICERRGHYDNGDFVKEWGDEGAKKGWCLFKMGCKGPYAFLNCPSAKFNDGVSWPVQAGHGCIACCNEKFFDKFANEREMK